MSETDAQPRIAIGSDHTGFPVKEAIRKYLDAAGYPVDDQGTCSEESVDYPDYGRPWASESLQNKPILASLFAAQASGFPSPPTKSLALRRPCPWALSPLF